MMSTLRVKASSDEEFDEACTDGCVFGKAISSRPIYYVYVELGKEGTYQRTSNDDEKTDYKIFYECDAFSSLSQEDLDKEIYDKTSFGITVIVYGNSQKQQN